MHLWHMLQHMCLQPWTVLYLSACENVPYSKLNTGTDAMVICD